MPKKSLMSSMDLQDDYLGGALKRSFTVPWSQIPSNHEETEGNFDYTANLVRSDTGSFLTMSVKFAKEPEMVDIIRSACHMAIETLPEKGINELCAAIAEMLHYYSEEISLDSRHYLPAIDVQAAIAGPTYERTPFQIKE